MAASVASSSRSSPSKASVNGGMNDQQDPLNPVKREGQSSSPSSSRHLTSEDPSRRDTPRRSRHDIATSDDRKRADQDGRTASGSSSPSHQARNGTIKAHSPRKHSLSSPSDAIKADPGASLSTFSGSASASPMRSPSSSVASSSSMRSRSLVSPPKKEYTLTPVTTSLPSSARRKKSIKADEPPPQIVDHLPRADEEALETFTQMEENWYAKKSIGRSQGHEQGLVCECNYRPGKDDLTRACTDEGGCINRVTQIECVLSDCRCGRYCQNQRFQRKEYADVEVIKTPQKGFGLRAGSSIPAETFVYEYIGEVVEEQDFHKRMRRYHDERIPHFYFMMLQRDEYLDATKKGGIARFINHSCNPNCYVAKWHVGKHFRMGIFSQRDILKGEELTFNYNVDRYGNEAQPCYCGEPNCVGTLGGKTQTDIGGMSNLYIEALGIVDEVERLQARGSKKQKSRILDEDFNPTLHALEEDEVPIVATAVRQAASNRSVLTKLLQRIELTQDVAVHKRFVRLHGFVLVAGVLTEWKDDREVVLSAMRILAKWPLIARNKVVDTGVEAMVGGLRKAEDEEVSTLAEELYDAWQQLSLEFRIARKEIEQAGDEDGSGTTSGIPGAAGVEMEDDDEQYRSRRRRDDEDSHQVIQERMDKALEDAQAPNDISARLVNKSVPKPLGKSSAASALSGSPGFWHGRPRASGGPGWWAGTPSTSRLSMNAPDTPRTPGAAAQAAASCDDSSFYPTPATSTQKMSIEEIIRRANEAQAVEQQEAEERRKNGKPSGSSSSSSKKRKGEVNGSSSSKEKKSRPSSSSHANGSSSKKEGSSSKDSAPASENLPRLEKKLNILVSELVIGVMSKYKDQLDREVFKKHAKELTGLIVEKEKRNEKTWPPGGLQQVKEGDEAKGDGVTIAEAEKILADRFAKKSSSKEDGKSSGGSSGEKREKVKKFAKDYVVKLVARKGIKKQESTSQPQGEVEGKAEDR